MPDPTLCRYRTTSGAVHLGRLARGGRVILACCGRAVAAYSTDADLTCKHCLARFGGDDPAPAGELREREAAMSPPAAFTLRELRELPTLAESSTSNLKIDGRAARVWLSRCTVADGELFDNRVTIEHEHEGSWLIVAEYPALKDADTIAYVVRRTYFDGRPAHDVERIDVERAHLIGSQSVTYAYCRAIELAARVRSEQRRTGYAVIDTIKANGERIAG